MTNIKLHLELDLNPFISANVIYVANKNMKGEDFGGILKTSGGICKNV